jgi:hypothetical protein
VESVIFHPATFLSAFLFSKVEHNARVTKVSRRFEKQLETNTCAAGNLVRSLTLHLVRKAKIQ